jgi:hypothetical protein
VKIQDTSHEPHKILFSWQNDRVHVKERPHHFEPFFRVISASPKMNRLLTGQRFFDRNPGWRERFQVVLITSRGSFPLPCADKTEQDQMIHRITRFVERFETKETRIGTK